MTARSAVRIPKPRRGLPSFPAQENTIVQTRWHMLLFSFFSQRITYDHAKERKLMKVLSRFRQALSSSSLCLVALSALAVNLFIVASPAYAATPAPRTVITGHVIPKLQHQTPIRTADGNRALQLSISLRLRNQAALDTLLADQNNPASSSYKQYLTPEQFKQNFSPTNADVKAITDFLTSQGLHIGTTSPNNTLITATGSTAQVEKAFQTELADYSNDGQVVFAPKSEPSVPAALGGIILNIAGLNSLPPHHHLTKVAAVQPHLGPGGGYTPSELRTAYDVNSLISAGFNGTGQTVAIFELDGYPASDVNTYLSNYGLGAAKYSNVLVDGATNTAGAGAGEVVLDMEVVSALAPGATQKIYIGPNTTAGVNDTYNKIVTDNIAKVTSSSWGQCEASSGNAELAALDNIFKQGAAQGQSTFSASGDSGAYDCNDTANSNTSLAVDSPSGDPYVVGVGGTNLVTGSGGTYSSESAWSCTTCTQRSATGSGTGGGFSSYFAKPTYQTGTGVPAGNRTVPDVAADADPASGYSVYCTTAAAGCSPTSGWTAFGGTSAAAPLWSALAADTNQYLASLSKPGLGNVNATLYSLFNTAQTYPAYHDVTSGNNLHYNSGTGYDLPTGIGTPDAWNLARDVAGTTSGGSAPTVSSFSPTSGPVGTGVTVTGTNFTGTTAVAFNGTAATFTVTNATTIATTVPSGATSGTIKVTTAAGSGTSSTSFTVTTVSGSGITNGGFESGLSGWTSAGTTSTNSTAHSGSLSAQVGGTGSTNGDSSVSQTFTVPSGFTSLSFWYRVVCPDTVTYDWATATLKDNAANTTATVLAKTCTNNSTWVQVSTAVTAGKSYTLTLISHDDNYAGDPTYTLYDDVALSAPPANPIVNGGFESGLTGWTSVGTTSTSSTAHSGSASAQVGSTSPTNGDSSVSQSFTAPSGSSTVSFWYRVVCPDTVTYDWATATLKDTTTNTTTTILAKTCNNAGTWVQVSATVTGGHGYTLTLISHDDNYAGDPTYTLYDDVAVA